MSGYLALKYLHVTCVVISGLGFLLRGWWMWSGSAWAGRRLVRRLPHVVDTFLLGSALTMAWLSHQYPFVQAWLTAKFFALLIYIVAGSFALKRGRTRRTRALCLIPAILAFLYIIGVAVTRNAQPWLAVI